MTTMRNIRKLYRIGMWIFFRRDEKGMGAEQHTLMIKNFDLSKQKQLNALSFLLYFFVVFCEVFFNDQIYTLGRGITRNMWLAKLTR